MSVINYPRHTPYGVTPQSSGAIGLYVDRRIAPDDGDILYAIDAGYQYRPDLLSYKLYGTTNFWWVFYRRNLGIIKDPVWGFTTGTVIVVPARAYLERLLG